MASAGRLISRCGVVEPDSAVGNLVVMMLIVVMLEVLSSGGDRAVAAAAATPSLPLSTTSRWVVDQSGARVKFACVNWAGHLEACIPEGLNKNSADAIAELVAGSGFNCVRLTSATWLWTNDAVGGETVAQNFEKLGLAAASRGIAAFNPSFLNATLREVHHRVVAALAARGVMVILDNHVSKPQWCCGNDDGNGFWGDAYFDAATWLRGLTAAAAIFKGSPYVVAMSMRNELRGPRQNSADWFTYMQQAAEAVHAANPDVLIIVGGLSYARDLSFLSSRQLDTATFPDKLVYEFHWYKLAAAAAYDNASDTTECAQDQHNIDSSDGFLVTPQRPFTAPLLLSEFGINLTGADPGDARFLNCVASYLQQRDLDWALWALQGSYYLRDGVQDLDESFGLLTDSWHAFRNAAFLSRLQDTLQKATQGPL